MNLAEKTILIPPSIVAILAVMYRNTLFCFHCSKLYRSVDIVSNEIMETVTTMINNTHNKALIIHESSETFLARCIQTMALALHTVHEGALLLVMRIQGFFVTIYQKGHESISQTANFLESMLEQLVTKKNQSIDAITNYFTPTPKLFYEHLYTPAIVFFSFCVLAVTMYYLQKNRVLQQPVLEEFVLEDPILQERKPLVRRKNRN